MKTLLAATLSAVTLAACASAPTPREASNAWSEGYTEHALSADRYLVEYRMEGSDYRRAYDLALWRAAQLTLERGYTAFEVVGRDTDTDIGSRPDTTISTYHTVSYQRSCSLVSCTTYAKPQTWYGLDVDNGRRPARVVSLEIQLMHDSATASPNRYNAAAVAASRAGAR